MSAISSFSMPQIAAEHNHLQNARNILAVKPPDYAMAERELRLGLQAAPLLLVRFDLLYELGKMLIAMKRFAEAELPLKEAISLVRMETTRSIHLSLFYAYLGQDKPKEALDLLKECLSFHYNEPEMQFQLLFQSGQLHAVKNRWEEASPFLQEALKIPISSNSKAYLYLFCANILIEPLLPKGKRFLLQCSLQRGQLHRLLRTDIPAALRTIALL